MRGGLALLVALFSMGGASAEGCGNAGSVAEVVEGSRGRGPVVSRPSNLCADIERRETPPIDVHVGITPPAEEQGDFGRQRRR